MSTSRFVREIDHSQYQEQVLDSPQPVVVDFFSTECPPCEALAPKFDAIADQFGEQVRFVKVFRQGNRDLSTQLGITGSPTLLFFRNGAEVGERLTGEIKRSELKKTVEAMLG